MSEAWAKRFRDYVTDAANLVNITRVGIRHVHTMPDVLEILRGVDNQTSYRVDETRELADLAKHEIDADFPLLYAHSLMGLWGALEAMVEDLAIEWIGTGPGVLEREVFKRIKVHVAVWEALTPEERHRHLLVEVQNICRAELSQGVGQFESVLREIGLGGGVDPELRQSLFVAQQIRHLIAHRAGRVDAKFIQRCPQLGYAAGDVVKISSEQFNGFVISMAYYSRLLMNRERLATGGTETLSGVPEADWPKVRATLQS